MIGKIILLATVAIASGNLAGVDPNSLSCDPAGLVFLLLPDREDCSKFYMCTHGEEVLFNCPDGLIFDFANQVCNWPNQAECILRGEQDEDSVEIEEGSGEGSGWDEDKPRPPPSPPRPPPGPRVSTLVSEVHDTSDQTVAHLNCAVAQGSARMASYRGDCQRYWRCVNGVAETAFCTDGLYFNPKSLQCDFEANVACARDGHDELGEEFIRM